MPLPKAPTKPATLLDLSTAVLARPPRPKGRSAEAAATGQQAAGAVVLDEVTPEPAVREASIPTAAGTELSMPEGAALLPDSLAAAGVSSPAAQEALYRHLLSAGLCFHGYQQLSYMILSRVSPVTHSIGNCVKRVRNRFAES